MGVRAREMGLNGSEEVEQSVDEGDFDTYEQREADPHSEPVEQTVYSLFHDVALSSHCAIGVKTRILVGGRARRSTHRLVAGSARVHSRARERANVRWIGDPVRLGGGSLRPDRGPICRRRSISIEDERSRTH